MKESLDKSFSSLARRPRELMISKMHQDSRDEACNPQIPLEEVSSEEESQTFSTPRKKESTDKVRTPVNVTKMFTPARNQETTVVHRTPNAPRPKTHLKMIPASKDDSTYE